MLIDARGAFKSGNNNNHTAGDGPCRLEVDATHSDASTFPG